MDGQGQLAWESSGRRMATAFRTWGAAGWIRAGRRIERKFDREFDIYRSLEILTIIKFISFEFIQSFTSYPFHSYPSNFYPVVPRSINSFPKNTSCSLDSWFHSIIHISDLAWHFNFIWLHLTLLTLSDTPISFRFVWYFCPCPISWLCSTLSNISDSVWHSNTLWHSLTSFDVSNFWKLHLSLPFSKF
jgi:hypothetical protein